MKRTAPRRDVDATTWHIGESLIVGDTRWIIRTTTPEGGVELEAANSLTSMWWSTTLDRLPAKQAAA